MSVCKSKEKNENHRFFLNYFFLKMGTSPKSSVFATVGSRTSTNGVVQRGNTTGTTIRTTGEKKRETAEKSEKKSRYFFFC